MVGKILKYLLSGSYREILLTPDLYLFIFCSE